MKKYIIATVFIAPVFTLLIRAACTEKDEAENHFLDLLGLIPVTIKNLGVILVIDYASFWQDNDISFSSPEEYINAMMEDEAGNQLVSIGQYITGNSGSVDESTIKDKYVGYNVKFRQVYPLTQW